jgi:hypothetical protein
VLAKELCALKVEHIHKDYFQIADAKTATGWGDIPICSTFAR